MTVKSLTCRHYFVFNFKLLRALRRPSLLTTRATPLAATKYANEAKIVIVAIYCSIYFVLFYSTCADALTILNNGIIITSGIATMCVAIPYLHLSVYLLCSYADISFDTAKCPSVFLLHVCIYQSIHLSVRPSVCPSVTRRYSVDTTQHIHNFYRTTHMHSADYTVATYLSDHSSLCLSDSPSVCHTTNLPPCTGRKKHRHIWNKLSVYHVHSYVPVCLSTTAIRSFRTFLRLSVSLHVFVYVYFHANILFYVIPVTS